MNILLPAHIITLAFFILGGQVPQDLYQIVMTLPFVVTYLVAVSVQMFILLKVSSLAIFSKLATRYGFDPHHSALPMITSVTSLLSSAAMAVLFALMKALGDPNGTIVSSENVSSFQFNNSTTTVSSV